MKAQTLGEVIKYFNHQKPLTPGKKEEWESLYIDTHRLEIEWIKNEFLEAATGHKLLFGGHSGNGKSTELNKFIYDKDIRKHFAVIKLDIPEILNPYDIEIVELLLVICFQILTFAEEKNITPSKNLKDRFENLEGFFHKKLGIETSRVEMRSGATELKSEAGAGFKFPFLKFKADFFAKMRGEAESRKLVRQEYRPRLNELIDLVKDLLSDIMPKLKQKKPIIIIDGLDRTSVSASEKLFAEDGQSIALLDNATMLLTVPISLIHSVKSAVVESTIGKMHVLKNIRLFTQEKKKDSETEKNWDLMRKAIHQRMESSLISDKALDTAVYYSGGVFRVLIDLIATAAVISRTITGTNISEKDMEEAVKEHRIKKTRPLDRSHWEILVEIDKHKKFIGKMDEKRLELLLGLFALEYINGDEWYSVNPLLESRLEDWRELLEAKEE